MYAVHAIRAIRANHSRQTTESSSKTPFFDRLDDSVLSNIVGYVGDGHYRFVAGINRRFRDTYSHVFPENTNTQINTSTIKHATICWEEWNHTFFSKECAVCCSAARDGDIAMLQSLRSPPFNCLWDAGICPVAAVYGHLHVIQWCRDNGCPWDAKVCAFAAWNGHLRVIQWCHENGCPWDEDTCMMAAENGHLQVLQWCRAHKCPWPRDM